MSHVCEIDADGIALGTDIWHIMIVKNINVVESVYRTGIGFQTAII